MKKASSVISILLVFVLIFSASASALTPKEMTSFVTAWLQKNITVNEVGTDIDPYLDWTVIATARCGKTEYVRDYRNYIGSAVKAHFDELYLVDYARISLAAMSVGLNPKDVGGHNLLEAIVAADLSEEAFTGGIAYALIALKSASFSPEKQTALINVLLKAQRPDGGFNAYLAADEQASWTLTGETDSTGIALQALAAFTNEAAVMNCISAAVGFIKLNQMDDGGFGSWGSASAESISQVIAGLCAVGIDPTHESLTKGDKTMLTALSSFVNPDGGIRCYDGSSNIMSGYQTLCGLSAYERFANGDTGLFEMSRLAEIQNSIEHSFIGKLSPKVSDWLCEIAEYFYNLFGIESYVYPK